MLTFPLGFRYALSDALVKIFSSFQTNFTSIFSLLLFLPRLMFALHRKQIGKRKKNRNHPLLVGRNDVADSVETKQKSCASLAW